MALIFLSIPASSFRSVPPDARCSRLMPPPGKTMKPLSSRSSSSLLRRNGAAVVLPVGLADDLVEAVALGPLGGDLLDAGADPMQQHHAGILGAGLVKVLDDGARVGDSLAAGDGDQGACRQVRPALAVFLPRRKSPASMAAKVSLTVWLVRLPWRGRQVATTMVEVMKAQCGLSDAEMERLERSRCRSCCWPWQATKNPVGLARGRS